MTRHVRAMGDFSGAGPIRPDADLSRPPGVGIALLRSSGESALNLSLVWEGGRVLLDSGPGVRPCYGDGFTRLITNRKRARRHARFHIVGILLALSGSVTFS